MIKRNSIFSKILILTVSLIIFICTVLTAACIKISEKIILKQIIQGTNENLEYVKEELIEYNADVILAMSKINQSSAFKEYLSQPIVSNSQRFELIKNLNDYIKFNKDHLTPKGSYIIAVGENGMWYSSNSINWDEDVKDFFKKDDFFGEGVKNIVKYKVVDTKKLEKIGYDNVISVSKPLVNRQGDNAYAFLYIVMNERIINKMYSKYVDNGMTYSLISSNGEVMSSNKTSNIDSEDLDLLYNVNEIVKSSSDYKKVDSNNTLVVKYVPIVDAYLTVTINHEHIFGKLYNLKYYMIMMLVILLIITCISIYIIYYNFSKPLISLVDSMSKTTRCRLEDRKVILGSDYETKILTEAYNTMIEEIDLHVKNLISEQEERRKAELNALQMQINPHFLYNTLSIIKYLAKGEKFNEVDKTIDCLISILQNTIGTTDEMVSIKSEIENMKLYVYINKLRFGNFINVDYQISEECYDLLIPKLILQPFVENAFFHAFQGADSGNITIYINKKGENIFIEIIDNGIGFDCNNINSLKRNNKRKGGIGVKNVDERIKLIYGSKYNVEINSEKGYGTCISIKIPIV
ncbi:sensor histidine kinase [Clostridium carnis]